MKIFFVNTQEKVSCMFWGFYSCDCSRCGLVDDDTVYIDFNPEYGCSALLRNVLSA
jgi:hypothetical protein